LSLGANYVQNMPPKTKRWNIKMGYFKFNGIFEEIIARYPNIDIVEFLQDKLQLPLFKAEELANRIEKKYCLSTISKTEQKSVKNILEKPTNSELPFQTNTCPIDCLSQKEFENFIRWLLEELSFKVEPKNYTATSGVDLVATKDGERIAIQARRYPKNHKVSDIIILISQDSKRIYECNRSIAIATTYFSEKAMADAKSGNVEIWDIDALSEKVCQVKKNADLDLQSCFPLFKVSLLQSLLRLQEEKKFIIEPRADEKFDLYLPGVKFPLLTFQTLRDSVIRCIYRIKYNEPVGESEGETLLSSADNQRSGPDDVEAYALVVEYLKHFVE